jgi:hypothetical protein
MLICANVRYDRNYKEAQNTKYSDDRWHKLKCPNTLTKRLYKIKKDGLLNHMTIASEVRCANYPQAYKVNASLFSSWLMLKCLHQLLMNLWKMQLN